jgi:hypothetical protein
MEIGGTNAARPGYLNDNSTSKKGRMKLIKGPTALTLVGIAIVLLTTLLLWFLPFRIVAFLAICFGLLYLSALYETSNMDS